MTGYVIDASVAVKWLVTEAFSKEAAGLLDTDPTLIAPELLFAEAANALWAMWRRGDIGKADLAEAIDVLRAAPLDMPRLCFFRRFNSRRRLPIAAKVPRGAQQRLTWRLQSQARHRIRQGRYFAAGVSDTVLTWERPLC